MGDASDLSDVGRFMRSPEGKQVMADLTATLQGRTITDVDFNDEVHGVVVTATLDDDTTVEIHESAFDLENLREDFAEVLEREYAIDYPERT